MEQMSLIISSNIIYVILFLVLSNILSFVFISINNSKLKKIVSKHNILTGQMNDDNLEKVVIDYYEKVRNIINKNKDIEIEIMKLKKLNELCIQKVGVIRYNAFSNVGSDLSFVIACLDAYDNGFVLNGIYSRETSTTYCKPIQDGKCKYTLSAEEIQAMDLARKNYTEREYLSK